MKTMIAAALGFGLVTSAALAQAPKEAAPKGELSEKSVLKLMDYAWTVLPAKFTTPEGKTIVVDKSKGDAGIPVDTGRDVIKVGYLSAQAQLCELWEEQVANFDALMAREQEKKRSDQQMLYISTLHRMTIHMAAGKMRVVDKGENETQIFLEPIEPAKDACNDDRKKQIREAVLTYIKASPVNIIKGNPPPATAAAPAASAPAATSATSAQPIPAAEKKK